MRGFAADVLLSPTSFGAALLVLAAFLAGAGGPPYRPGDGGMSLLVILLFAGGGLIWLVNAHRPRYGGLFASFVLTILAYLTALLLGTAQCLGLLVAVVALAAGLAGWRAAIACAVLVSLFLLLRPDAPAGDGDAIATAMTLFAVWTTAAVAHSLLGHTEQLSAWLWEYFRQSQSLLEETRDRRAELAQSVSDLEHVNRQLELTNERLAAMRLLAEEAQRAKADFVARVSHEFRTPLYIITALTDLIVEGMDGRDSQQSWPGDRALREDLRTVHRNAQHLSEMVNDVLDLSQAQAGRLALRREQVDVGNLITDALAVLQPLIAKKGLATHVGMPPGSLKVDCDRTRIRQVVLNLVGNAVRFTDSGSITVDVALQGEWALISVADTGPGIPAQEASRIFEPFRQASDLAGDKGGSGLGLTVSKQFVELHGGRMWLESQLGHGSTFYVELPLARPGSLGGRPEQWLKEEWPWLERVSRAPLPATTRPSRIILWDETEGLRPLLERSGEGVELVNVKNLDEAVQLTRRYPAHLVLINATPEERLRAPLEAARQALPDTPIMGCSVLSPSERAVRAGATTYLTKPIAKSDLARAIAALAGTIRRVLVVEDEPDAQKLSIRMLRTLGGVHDVTLAASGEEALRQLRHSRPDLVLLDVVLPDMDGWAVLATKQQDRALQGIPVIMVSAQDPSDRPAVSTVLVGTMAEGIPPVKLLRCSLALSSLLLAPD
jgi:signal transduction histidine kinase/CheY-like chemotaxis protein